MHPLKSTYLALSRPELRRNGRFNVLPKSVFLAKNYFFPKKHPKFAASLICIWKRVFFSLHNFARLWQEHGFDYEVGVFWPKKSDFDTKIRFFAIGHWSICHPWIDFLTFCFGITVVFVKKKSSPSSLLGHRLPVTAQALSALRAQAG